MFNYDKGGGIRYDSDEYKEKVLGNQDGGPGSGNWGHAGVPGKVGGSASGGGTQNRQGSKKEGFTSEAKKEAKEKKSGGGKQSNSQNNTKVKKGSIKSLADKDISKITPSDIKEAGKELKQKRDKMKSDVDKIKKEMNSRLEMVKGAPSYIKREIKARYEKPLREAERSYDEANRSFKHKWDEFHESEFYTSEISDAFWEVESTVYEDLYKRGS